MPTGGVTYRKTCIELFRRKTTGKIESSKQETVFA
jgi:hypothetical protein